MKTKHPQKANIPRHKNVDRSIRNSASNSNANKTIYVNSSKKRKRLGKTCKYFNDEKLTCKLHHKICNNADECDEYVKKGLTQTNHSHKNADNKLQKVKTHKQDEIGVTAVVISDNRKCTKENHQIIDVNAKIRVVKSSGEIITALTPAAYCEKCDTYFILKEDYKKVKAWGMILCPIDDCTNEYLARHKQKMIIGSESKIHQLGYNVRKNNGCTYQQRQIILANIIENTDISKHEIISNIRRCIAQHEKQVNYKNSVTCWKNDLAFVENYKIGNIPEVIIEKIVIGKRI